MFEKFRYKLISTIEKRTETHKKRSSTTPVWQQHSYRLVLITSAGSMAACFVLFSKTFLQQAPFSALLDGEQKGIIIKNRLHAKRAHYFRHSDRGIGFTPL
ncbi:hypothetical protein NPIL_241831 [Nephila pilipes]|uniref:Uncharacterized protein n=1 Tax=Nephila pilipes TaxID=299642 RepID=A0A8X6NSJ7_NEPPI|nr:hypothetical protein NPIL_241831 [Nephila pilipes]